MGDRSTPWRTADTLAGLLPREAEDAQALTLEPALLTQALRQLLEEGAPAFVTGGDGRLLYANAAYRRLLPLLIAPPTEGAALPAGIELPPAGPNAGWSETVDRPVDLLGPAHQNYLCRHAVLRDEAGAVRLIVGRYIPPSNEDLLRRQLGASQERLHDIARLVSDWIWETDRARRLTYLSDRVIEGTGRHPRTLLGRPIAELFHDPPPPFAEPGEPVPQPFRDLEARVLHSDGSARIFRLSGVPVYAEDSGAFLGFRGTAQDITDSRLRERALQESRDLAERASRAKSEFLATVSHELRTPLNAIIGFSEIMVAESFGPMGNETYRGYVGDILHSGQHLLQVINDILDVSKIEAGRLEIDDREVDSREVAASALRFVGERAGQWRIELKTDLPEDLPHILADERALKQVLLNVLSNAIKFTADAGSVKLSARLDANGDFLFVVEDSGIGMTPEEIEIALKPFGQVDSRLSRKFPGTGLGLPLAKGLIEHHGGGLEIESEPGVGTTVIVRLPASRVLQP